MTNYDDSAEIRDPYAPPVPECPCGCCAREVPYWKHPRAVLVCDRSCCVEDGPTCTEGRGPRCGDSKRPPTGEVEGRPN